MSRPLKIIISENVRRYMNKNNVTRRELEKVVGGKTTHNILNPEKTKGFCTVATLEIVADFLNTKVINLVEDWGEKE